MGVDWTAAGAGAVGNGDGLHDVVSGVVTGSTVGRRKGVGR
jgi:hypothetical protein